MIITVIFILLSYFILALDYSSTKGHIKAKVWQVIALTYLFYSHLYSFRWLIWIIKQGSIFYEKFNRVGIISSDLNFYQSIIGVGVGIVIVGMAFGMLRRNDFSRRNLIRVLPFIIPSSTISFYMGSKSTNPMNNDYIILIISFIFNCIIYFGIFFLYRSKFMIEFFNQKKTVRQ